MEREISTERQILSHLRNGEGEGGGEEVRKYFSRFVMIDDGRPSLLPANRPSVRCHRGALPLRPQCVAALREESVE